MWTCKEYRIEKSKLFRLTGEVTTTLISDSTMTDREVLRLFIYFLNDRDKGTLIVEPLTADSDEFREELKRDGVHVKGTRSYGYLIEHTIGGMTIRYHLEDIGPDTAAKGEPRGMFSGLLNLFK